MGGQDMSGRVLRVTVGVTGGVAAYKAAELVRALQQGGADVRVVMTRAAQEFVRPLTFSSLSGHKVITGLWGGDSRAGAAGAGGDREQGRITEITEITEEQRDYRGFDGGRAADGRGVEGAASGLNETGAIEHIAVAQEADAIVIAPATAHVLAKMAHGLADDFLSTMLLAATCPVIVAPAMNVNMWNHAATQANVALLRERGVVFVAPESGYLACGMVGSGRLASIEAIAQAVFAAVASAGQGRERDLVGETVLVTAGGTREAIDPVRFLGNRSSGKMGYALAEAAKQRGAQVVLVSAPTALTPPVGCAFVPVTSAEEMQAAVMEHLARATVVIGAAAVADFRMPRVAAEKLRREDAGLRLELAPTEDIVRMAARARSAGALVIAFAAEMELDVARARAKLAAKGVDAIVLNDVSKAGVGFDSERNAGVFVTAEDAVELPESTKRELAEGILDRVVGLRVAKGVVAGV
jgi:phosphopantothenoylcysteine decarboxylase/phosphopantothenate--cysteine ligase